MLKHTDNRGSFYDDDNMLAAALEALGRLRLPSHKQLQPVIKQLDRFLAREKVLPSYHGVVAQAGLRAFVELALNHRAKPIFVSKCVLLPALGGHILLCSALLYWALLYCVELQQLLCSVACQ